LTELSDLNRIPRLGLARPRVGYVAVVRIVFLGTSGMYAVIKTGGKQHRVSEGDTLRVEKLAADEGSSVEFDQVLLVSDGDNVTIGAPYVEGGKVTATVESHGRGDKVRILKFRRRKHHLKRQGHRQWFTQLKITGITAG